MMRFLIVVFLFILPQVALADGYVDCADIEIYALDGQTAEQITVEDFNKIWAKSLDVLLLGERHGVTAHPKIAACLLAESQDENTALLVEMLNIDQQAIIDQHRKTSPELFSKIVTNLKWWETGWPSWSTYSPMFDVAWLSRSGLIGADLPAAQSLFVKAAYSSFDTAQQESIAAGWALSMFQAHCGLISREEADKKGQYQMRRDAWMASKISSAALDYSKILFYAGRAHVREDRGLVQLVRRNLSGLNVATLALRERDLPKEENREALLRSYQGKYNFVGFIGEYHRKGLC